MHLTLVVVLPLFAWLTWWQLGRAEGGNSLSWAYVVLWPSFGIYALYTWWQLIHDQTARVPGRPRASGPTSLWADAPGARGATGAGAAGSTGGASAAGSSDDPARRPPGWALTGGRARNVAIAAEAPIDAERGGRGERFAPQTAEEAARLAEYNRYLAELAAESPS